MEIPNLANPAWLEKRYPKYMFCVHGAGPSTSVMIRKGRAYPDCEYFHLETPEGNRAVFASLEEARSWISESDPTWSPSRAA